VLGDIDVLRFLGRRSRRLGKLWRGGCRGEWRAVLQARVNAGNRLVTFAECETGSGLVLNVVECWAQGCVSDSRIVTRGLADAA
jgi:hypothetical protein